VPRCQSLIQRLPVRIHPVAYLRRSVDAARRFSSRTIASVADEVSFKYQFIWDTRHCRFALLWSLHRSCTSLRGHIRVSGTLIHIVIKNCVAVDPMALSVNAETRLTRSLIRPQHRRRTQTSLHQRPADRGHEGCGPNVQHRSCGSEKREACSGMKEVPSQPSAVAHP